MTSSEIRDSFLDFFKEKQHTIVPSGSLLPDARLHVVPGGTHSLAVERAAEAAAAVSAHLAGDADRGRSASPRAQGG